MSSLETTQQFAAKLTEIAELAFSHGSNNTPEEILKRPSDEWSAEESTVFTEKCHEGFKLAQKRLIIEVVAYQRLFKETKAKIKDARSKHQKQEVKELLNLEKVIARRLHNLSHIADGIVMEMVSHQVHIAKRLHIGEKGLKLLENSNINHAVEVADQINENPSNFALISDLTGFIQVGDLIVIDKDKGLYISELKEGETNERIREFIDLTTEVNGIPCPNFQNNLSEKELAQMKRMMKQDLRATQVVEIINEDKGIDPTSGAHVTVNTSTVDLIYYDIIFLEMLEELKEKEWSYRVLDSCLHIGMYHGDTGLMMAQFSISQIMKMQSKNYIVTDMMGITEQLSGTLFAKSLPKEFVVKLMTGQAKIIIGVDLDRLIEVFTKNGLQARWLSKSETGRRKSYGKEIKIVVVNGRAIGIKLNDGQEAMMSGGIISKIVYDNILPSSLAVSMATSTAPIRP